MENTYLAHYGVKGMKWGVRKERAVANRLQANRDKVAAYQDRVRVSSANKSAKRYDKTMARATAKQAKILSSGNAKKAERYLNRSSYNAVQSRLAENEHAGYMRRQMSMYNKTGRMFYAKSMFKTAARAERSSARAKAYEDAGRNFVKALSDNGYLTTARVDYTTVNIGDWFYDNVPVTRYTVSKD